jgi:cysteine desulfurase / selenocysteine lyase
MPVTAQEMRELFPITRRYAYLNVASIAPFAGPVRAAIDVYLGRQGEEPFDEPHWWKLREQVRGLVGQLLHVRPETCAFTHSTTSGLSLVAGGLDWRAGDNVVGVQGEYPANIYPWMALQERGVELRLYQPPEGRVDPAGLLDRCDARTRLVAISLVQFWNGFRSDLAAIGRGCRERDVFLIVDGVQGIGGLDIDVSTLPVDFVAAGAQKYLLGPMGIGVVYIGERLFEQLRPVSVGTDSVVKDDEYFEYDLTLKPNARRFEDASPNLPGILGLGAALNLLVRAGLTRVEAHILRLAQLLRDELPRRGYQLVAPGKKPAEFSGIVSFRHPRTVPDEVNARLRDARVILSRRGDFLRASVHYYNSEDDIERLLEALPA